MGEGDEVDIDGILSDLDSILSGGAPAENLSLPSAPQSPGAAAPTASSPPGAAPSAVPVPAPISARQPAPAPEANIPAASPPAPGTKPAESARQAPPLSPDLKIELGPRQGLGVVKPAPTPTPVKPVELPKPAASAYRPPLEIQAPATSASAAPPPPATQPPPAVVQLPPVPVAAAPVSEPKLAAAAPAPASAPASAPTPALAPAAASPATTPPPSGADDSIPANVPKDQIRKVACVYGAGQKRNYEEFIKFIDTMALHFTKKSLYLRKCLVIELSAAETPQELFDKIKTSGAVGVVGLLSDASEAKLKSLEDSLSAAGLFFRWIPSEDIGKRSTAVDLLVDLTLLSAG